MKSKKIGGYNWRTSPRYSSSMRYRVNSLSSKTNSSSIVHSQTRRKRRKNRKKYYK